MVREPDATMQPTLQDNQLMSKHRVFSLKPQLRPEWRGQDGQSETEQPDHSASLCDSITSSTQIRFSVHTVVANILTIQNPSMISGTLLEWEAWVLLTFISHSLFPKDRTAGYLSGRMMPCCSRQAHA